MSQHEIIYKCPRCKRRLSSPKRHAGKLGTCPRCGRPVMVPVRSEHFAFVCVCEHRLYGKRTIVGKPVRCPFCKRLIQVPEPRTRKKLPDDDTSFALGTLPAARLAEPAEAERSNQPDAAAAEVPPTRVEPPAPEPDDLLKGDDMDLDQIDFGDELEEIDNPDDFL